MGRAATDKKATWKEIHVLKFEEGKAVEHWGVVDMMGLMMQLGVMPQPETMKMRWPQFGSADAGALAGLMF